MNQSASEATTAIRAGHVQQFARTLLTEIAAQRAPFPGWSRTAESLCRVAAAEDSDRQPLLALLSSQAELSMRIVAMANSPLFARAGRRLTELQLAVRRLGRDNLRGGIYGWALAQLRFAPRLAAHRTELTQLWFDSTAVAAVARHLVARVSELDAGTALLAGLLHNVGKYYLIAQFDNAQPPLIEPALREQLLSNWHTVVGRELARNWALPATVCEAIGLQESTSLGAGGAPTLASVLATAIVAARAPDPVTDTAEHLAAFSPLALSAADWQKLLLRTREEVDVLRVLLGD